MTPLAIGTTLAVAALAYVLYPLTAAPRRPISPPAVTDEELETLIGNYRTPHVDCPTCGPRPEADAIYCSGCGKQLVG